MELFKTQQKEVQDQLHKIETLRPIKLGLIGEALYSTIVANSRVIIQIEYKGGDAVMKRWWQRPPSRVWASSPKGVVLLNHAGPKEGFYTMHQTEYDRVLKIEN